MQTNFSREDLLNKFAKIPFEEERFTSDSLIAKDLIFSSMESDNYPTTAQIDISNGFYTEKTSKTSSHKNTRDFWRKFSEPDRRHSNFKISKAEDIEISYLDDMKTSSEITHQIQLSIIPNPKDELDYIVGRMVPKGKNHTQINSILQINKYLNIPESSPIWMIQSRQFSHLLFYGPFSSTSIAHFYNNKIINDNTELKPLINEVKEGDVEFMNLHGEKFTSRDFSFTIKTMCQVFGLKIESSSIYCNPSIYTSNTMNIIHQKSRGSKKPKKGKGKKQNYDQSQYGYDYDYYYSKKCSMNIDNYL